MERRNSPVARQFSASQAELSEIVKESKISTAVKFEKVPFYEGRIEYSIIEADVKNKYKINLRFVRQAPNLIREVNNLIVRRILPFLNSLPEPDLQAEAGHTRFEGHEGEFINNWDVVIWPFSKTRANFVCQTIIEDFLLKHFKQK